MGVCTAGVAVALLLLVLLVQPGQSQYQQYQGTPTERDAIAREQPGRQHTPGPGAAIRRRHAPQQAAEGQQRATGYSNTPEHTRRLSAATQARPAAVTAPQPPAAPGPADRCPAASAELSTPGCTCTVYRSNSRRDEGSRTNVCPAGYRCSPAAVEAVMSGIMAGWSLNSSSRATSSTGVITEQGICIPCQLGEYCPAGTQEETQLSISACAAQSLSISNQTANGTSSNQNSSSHASLASDTCSGVKLCPGGSFCPSAAEQRPCDAGRWCPAGSIKSQPCNITGLLVWNPFAKAPGSSQLVLETLVKAAQPLDGNSCPFNATNPLQGCPPGYFCPTAAEQVPCPRGYFCPGHTSTPVTCPALGSCVQEQETAPDWSWLGVALMLLLLAALMLLLEYVRLSGRSNRTAQSQEDDVMHLVEAVGFKMVGSHGTYHVSRAAAAAEQGHLRSRLSSTVSSTTTAFARVLRSASGRRHKHNEGAARHTGSDTHAADDAVLTVEEAPAGNPGAAQPSTWLRWPQRHKGPQPPVSTGAPPAATLAAQASLKSPFEMSALGKDASDAALPSVSGPVDKAGADDSEEFVINPRLTLVFNDVWVADTPIEEGLARGAKRRLLGLLGKRCSAPSHSSSTTHASPPAGLSSSNRISSNASCSGGGNSSNSNSTSTSQPKQEMVAKLEAAAAAGAFFIVPGVSSRFAHSQLHAIMGPSGCGKTTLCKALAGRVPLNRMCGDVRLLCSSAADNFKAEVELAASDSMRGAGAVSNISHMTGFVPQFDQLHESLTVLENLLLAARLRLPVTGKGQGVSAAAGRAVRRQRHREVHKVVGEVMALMALSKVATTVVGSSTQRLLSGGQRKRVAIGVELVSKPSLLWLDEPTSGLDAAVAYDVLAALKASSERGMNVLAVMHQPRCSIFNMFDSCLLLGGDGNVVYSGPQRMAQAYMAFLGFYIPPNENLADFLLDVTSGVVPRPGDPDYIPSQLSAMWHKAGGIWVDQQLRKAAPQRRSGLQPTTSEDITALLPVAPAVDTPVDWPWRPRDLEALLARFNLLADSSSGSSQDGQLFGRERFARSSARAEGPSVLTYDGFIAFWDDSGIEDLLGEEYADFIAGLCKEFALQPGGTITRARFVEVLKAQLQAAAAAADHTPLQQLSAGRKGAVSAAASSGSGSDADTPTAYGVLAGPQARLRQHTMRRQQTLQRQSSRQAGGLSAGPLGARGMGQPQMQALSRWKKAQQAATTAAVLNARLQQLKKAPNASAAAAALQPCSSIQEARTLGLDQLGDFLVKEAGQQQAQPSSSSSSAASTAEQHSIAAAPSRPPALTRIPTVLEVDTLPSDDWDQGVAAAPAAAAAAAAEDKAAAAAAAAAVSSRKLPSLLKQLELVVMRCCWKAVLSRSAFMTDLLLTTLLGLALGVAQGRNIQPGSSLMWMLITLLAYGSISLVRSARSYGNERHLYLQQESPAGVSVTAWVFGHQLFDLVGLMLHPMLFFAWIYVLTLTPVPPWSYFTTLVAVGFYTSGLGYLVSLTVSPHNAMVAGLAVALLLGGVANGVVPNMWQLASTHPLFWLDHLSYTRWGLQALYISWLIPAPAPQAPATATFLSGLGFCGLDPGLLQALKGRSGGWDATASSGIAFNNTAADGQQWWNMTSAERSTAMARAAAVNLRNSPPANRPNAAAAAAITQLWEYYNHPHLLNRHCNQAHGTAVAVLVALGLACRLSVWVLVRIKVARKAQQ